MVLPFPEAALEVLAFFIGMLEFWTNVVLSSRFVLFCFLFVLGLALLYAVIVVLAFFVVFIVSCWNSRQCCQFSLILSIVLPIWARFCFKSGPGGKQSTQDHIRVHLGDPRRSPAPD